MNLSVEIEISRPKALVWQAITDIKHCADMITGIINVQVLETPAQGVVGLKWCETRLMFGKEATETMWITEAVENEYYCTRAESHGSVYLTKLVLTDLGEHTKLSMEFSAEAQGIFVKVISKLMALFVKKSMIKMLNQDLKDIKQYVEQR